MRVRKDKYKSDKKIYIPHITKPFGYVKKEDIYIEDFSQEEKEKYKNHTIVGIDPNKGDLIYCSKIGLDKYGYSDIDTFRYTQNQRRKEIKTKKYRKILKDKMENKPIQHLSIDNVSTCNAREIESELSNCDFKSCIFDKAKKDLKIKNKVNNLLYGFYELPVFRKLKWFSFINKQRSEANMINNFKEKMGSPENILICFGDWCQNRTMKYNEPTKGRSMRTLFKKAGYNGGLIDEYNTSCKCYIDGKDMEKFRKRGNPRPKKKASKFYIENNKDIKPRKEYKYKIWHGLLRFKNSINNRLSRDRLKDQGVRFNKKQNRWKDLSKTRKNDAEHILINRDLNASLGIGVKAKCYINNLPLPEHYKRK